MNRGVNSECRTEWSALERADQERIMNTVGLDLKGNVPLVLNAYGPGRYLKRMREEMIEVVNEPSQRGVDSELPIFYPRTTEGEITGPAVLPVGLINVSQYFNFPTPREVLGFYANPTIPPEFFLPTLDILVERINLRLMVKKETTISRPPRFFHVTRN